MDSLRPIMHLLKLYNLLIAQNSEEEARKSSKTKKILKTDWVPGFCLFCNAENDLRSMDKSYSVDGINENYTDMLLECYNIEIVSRRKENNDTEICEACIGQLRSATSFRKQVEAMDEQLQHNLLKVNIHKKSKRIDIKKIKKPGRSKTVKNEHHIEIKQEYNLKIKESDFNSGDDDFADHFNDDNNLIQNDESVEAREILDTKNIINSRPYIFKKQEKTTIPPLDPLSTQCPVCGEMFDIHRSLVRHYPIHFTNYLCDICGSAFWHKHSLARHKITHSDERHPCKMCKRTYANRNCLLTHIRNFHKGKKGYCCTVCPERFFDYSARNKHIFEKHGIPRKTFPCTRCERVFYRSSRLAHHTRRDHFKQKNHVCAQCGYNFFSKGQLTMHMLKHTGVKAYGCDTCGKYYARKRTLTEHLKIHANVRAHKCEICDKAFVQKCTLKGHMKTHQKF